MVNLHAHLLGDVLQGASVPSLLARLFQAHERPDLVAQIRIGFPDDFESSSVASVAAKPEAPKGTENWVWDLYYAKTLYDLGTRQFSESLKQELDAWAVKWAKVLMGGLPMPSLEMLAMDKDLVLRKLLKTREEYIIDVIPGGRHTRGFDLIQTHLPKDGHQNRMAYSVLSLAHHYFITADENFTRSLPIHILAMHNYYKEIANYLELKSLLGAPFFATEKEIRWNKESMSEH